MKPNDATIRFYYGINGTVSATIRVLREEGYSFSDSFLRNYIREIEKENPSHRPARRKQQRKQV